MFCFRHYLVPALLLAAMIFVCGKLLLTPVAEIGRGRSSMQDTGWPWVFSQSEIGTTSSGAMRSEFHWWMLLADLAVMLAAIVVAVRLWRWYGRYNRHWLRFTVRGILAITTVAAVVCGWWTYHRNRWIAEQDALEKLDRTVRVLEYEDFEPAWLRRLWPHDDFPMFRAVTWIRIGDDPQQITDKQLQQISRFAHLRVLQFYDCPITDAGVAQLAYCRDLQRLDLSSTGITDVGLAQLAGLTQLTQLNLSGTAVSDRGIDSILQLSALEDVDLSDCGLLTDLGIGRLLELQHLTTALIPRWPQVSEPLRIQLKRVLRSRIETE